MDMDADKVLGPVTRSKSHLQPAPLESEPESESESEDESWGDRLLITRPGPPRLQQPNVYVNANLNKVKMEVDYNPIIAVKDEVKVENDDADKEFDKCSSSNLNADCDATCSSVSPLKEEPSSDPDDQDSSSSSEPPKKKNKSSGSLAATKVGNQIEAEQDNIKSSACSSSSRLSAPEAASKNIKVLEKIFSNVDENSLTLEPGEVAKLWNIFGSEDLVPNYFVGFSWDFEGRRTTRKSNEKGGISEFKAFLSTKPREVPAIPKISIGDPRDVQMWESLGVFGQVTSLQLNIIDFDVELFSSLIKLMPKLKYLHLPYEYKSFTVKGNFIKILSSMDSSVWENRSPLVIPSMTLRPSAVSQMKQMEKLSDCHKIVLEEAEFGILPDRSFKSRFPRCVSKLLSISQNTLKILTLDGCEGYLHLLIFPCMTGVTDMIWNFYGRQQSPRPLEFSLALQFSKKFPNLHSISILTHCTVGSLPRWEGRPGVSFFVTLFQNMGPAPSVKKLTYSDSLQDFIIEPLFQVFPNVEDLKAINSKCSESMFDSIWKQRKILKNLDISVDFYHERDLETFLTGFTYKTVNMLTEQPELPSYNPEELKQLRVKPSILDFTELQDLTIRIGFHHFVRLRLLAVAREYAFKLMPKNFRIVIVVTCHKRYRERIRVDLKELSKHSNVRIIFD